MTFFSGRGKGISAVHRVQKTKKVCGSNALRASYKCMYNVQYIPELANSIENTIAIAIDKGIFQLLLLLLLLIRASSNY